jgi:hypothetical protein
VLERRPGAGRGGGMSYREERSWVDQYVATMAPVAAQLGHAFSIKLNEALATMQRLEAGRMSDQHSDDGDWYFVDTHDDKDTFDRAIYEDLMASQGVAIDKHGLPLESTERTVAIKHLATRVAKRCVPRS